MKNLEAQSKTLTINKFFGKPKEPSLDDKISRAELVRRNITQTETETKAI